MRNILLFIFLWCFISAQDVEVKLDSSFIFVNKTIQVTIQMDYTIEWVDIYFDEDAFWYSTSSILPSRIYRNRVRFDSHKEVKVHFRCVKEGIFSFKIEKGVKIKYFANARLDPIETQKFKVRGVSAMHLSTYDTDDPIEVGQTTKFMYTFANEGTAKCTNIVLKVSFNDKVTFIKAGEKNKTIQITEKNGKYFFPKISEMLPGEKKVFFIEAKGSKEGSSKSTAELKYDEFKRWIVDEEGTSVYE